ncbi:MAG: hypothetical protein AAF620_08325 [Bacteroidota bacterium]
MKHYPDGFAVRDVMGQTTPKKRLKLILSSIWSPCGHRRGGNNAVGSRS